MHCLEILDTKSQAHLAHLESNYAESAKEHKKWDPEAQMICAVIRFHCERLLNERRNIVPNSATGIWKALNWVFSKAQLPIVLLRGESTTDLTNKWGKWQLEGKLKHNGDKQIPYKISTQGNRKPETEDEISLEFTGQRDKLILTKDYAYISTSSYRGGIPYIGPVQLTQARTYFERIEQIAQNPPANIIPYS